MKELDELKEHKSTLIFYEAPHRIKDFLVDVHEVFGDRKIAICRELTKLHEEVIRTTTTEVINILDTMETRGEFVIVIEGASEVKGVEIDIRQELKVLIESGMRKKAAVNYLVDKYELNKNEVYKVSLEL